jgi:Exonuclease
MSLDIIDLPSMAETLAKSPDYRVLRRLVPRTEFAPSEGQSTKTGILLDVETTGLNTMQDEIIELAMVKFDYLPDDRIARITDVFSSFNEPSNPIPTEITELTGIADEMVSGHRIDSDAVSAFASDAVIVIAHNANFDRKFAERYGPFSRESIGPAQQQRWNGEGLGSTDRALGIFWLALVSSIRLIELSMIVGPSSKSYLPTSPNWIGQLLRFSWNGPGERQYGFGPRNLRSSSRTR